MTMDAGTPSRSESMRSASWRAAHFGGCAPTAEPERQMTHPVVHPPSAEVARRVRRAQAIRRPLLTLLAIVLAVVVVVVFVTTERDAHAQVAAELHAESDALPPTAAGQDLRTWLNHATAAGRGPRLGFIDGALVASSSPHVAELAAEPALRDVLADPAARSGSPRVISLAGEQHMVVVVPVTLGTQQGLLVLARPLVAVQHQALRLGLWLGLGAAGVMWLALVVAGAVSRRYAVAATSRPKPANPGGPLRVVVAEGFLSRLAFGLVSFSLPLYAHHMGMSLPHIGLLLATNTAVAVVLKPLMGRVIDRVGVRTAFVFAVALRTAVVLALVFASAPVHLFLARGLHGVSIAVRDPSASTVLAALGGKQAVAQRFAWYQTAKTVAGSAGQVLAGILITALAGDYASVFLVATVLSALPLTLVLAGLRGPAVTGLRLPRHTRRPPLPPSLKAALLPYMGLGAAMTGTAYLMSNLLPVLAVSYMGLSAAAASSLYAFTAVVALSGPIWGWLADRVSLRFVLGVRALGNVASSLVWLVFPSYPGLVAGKVTDDVGKAAFRPAWGAVMARVSALDPSRRAQTLALMSTAEDAGELGAPVLAGVIWSTLGLPALLLMRAGAGLATEAYALWLARHVTVRAHEDDLTEPSSLIHQA